MHTRKKFIPVYLFIVFVLGFVIWVLQTPVKKMAPEPRTGEPLRVVASFYPVAEFARAVGGSFVHVETLTPNGTEPHDYEPTAEQIARIYASDVLLFNGGGVDAWASRIAPDVSAQGVVVEELSQVVQLLPSAPDDDHAAEDEHEESFDPHFWLNPKMVQKEIDRIEHVFSAADPANASAYKQNAEAYRTQLDALDLAYETGLATCEKRLIVTSHGALSYLARAYDFSVISISGLSPDEEPSAGRMAEVTRIAKEEQVSHIFFETLVHPKLAQTLASEIGAKTLVFNPLEGLSEEEQKQGKTYVTVMEDNLIQLKTGMLCQ